MTAGRTTGALEAVATADVAATAGVADVTTALWPGGFHPGGGSNALLGSAGRAATTGAGGGVAGTDTAC